VTTDEAMKKALARMEAMSPEEFKALCDKAEQEAARRSGEFSRKCRPEPWMYDIRITI
jgi:hypothetical protein